MSPPTLLLENFYLTRLHIDWQFPGAGPIIEVAVVTLKFDYDVGAHKENPRRRMLKLRAEFQELDANKREVGHHIECEMVGLFAFTEATPKEKEELILRVNGLNMLYGALRGILATVTAISPGGSFKAPSIMPRDIVEDVEKRHAKRQETAQVASHSAKVSVKSDL